MAAWPAGERPESALQRACSTWSRVGRSSPRASRWGRVRARWSRALRAPAASPPVTTSEGLLPKASGTSWMSPSPGWRPARSTRPLSASCPVSGLSVPASTRVGREAGLCRPAAGSTSGTTSPVVSSPRRAARSGSASTAAAPGAIRASMRSGISLLSESPSRPSGVYRLDRSSDRFAPLPGRPATGPGASGAARPGMRTTGPEARRTSTDRRPG